MTHPTSRARIVALAATAALGATCFAGAPSAAAAPAPCNGALLVKDVFGDLTNPAPFTASESGDIVGAFFAHDAGKGADATTVNILIKKLALELPTGFSSMGWNAIYTMPDESQKFVRAILDATGDLAFEYGDFVPVGSEETGQVTSLSQFRGLTKGEAVEGDNGLISIVVPADRGGAAGTKLGGVHFTAVHGRTLPNDVNQSPSRGLSSQVDEAPDTAPESNLAPTIGPCVAEAPVGAAPGDTPADGAPPAAGPPAPGGGSGGSAGPGTSGSAPVTISLATTKVAAKKAKKSLALALRSSGPVSRVTVLVKKGRATVAKGSLARLSGSGKAKLKVSKKLKKGAYKVTLSAIDSAGRAVSATGKLTVR